MIYKVLYIKGGEPVTDRLESRHLTDPAAAAPAIRQMYECLGMDVVGVIHVSEVEIDIY